MMIGNPPGSSPRRHPAILTIAILNITLGCVFGLCCGGYQFVQAASGALIKPFMGMVQTQMEADRARREQGFASRLAAAKTEEEKQQIEKERDQWRAMTPNFDMEAVFSMYDDPRWVGYLITDGVTCIIVNALLVVSGVGMLWTLRWARTMALIVAAAKVVRVLVSCAYTILVIGPLTAEATDRMMQEMNRLQQSAPGPVAPMPLVMPMGKMSLISTAAQAVFTAAVASSYPIVVLVVLNLRSVRQAFGLRSKAAGTSPAEGA